MKLNVLRSCEEIDALQSYLTDKEFVAFDTETTGLAKDSQVIGFSVCAEESQAYYIVLQEWRKSSLYRLDNMKRSKTFLEFLITKKLVMHNSVFDCIMVNNNFTVDLMPSVHTDTMILAHLLNENRRVGLKDLALKMFGADSDKEQSLMKASIAVNGGSTTRGKYELYKADPDLIGKYGAKDALLTYKLFLELVPQLYEQQLDKFFYEEESMPLLRGPTYQLNKTGLKVNSAALNSLKKTLEVECLEAKAFVLHEIASHISEKYPGTTKQNGFNIGASQQLSWLLFEKLGLEFGTLTTEGRNVCKALGLKTPYTYKAKRDFMEICKSAKDTIYARGLRDKKVKDPWCYIACDKKTLASLSHKRKWIERLLEYQRKTKILNTYVFGIEERIQYGVIYPSFLQHGTSSGRYSSRDPNFQNLPRDDKRIKALMESRPGKVFVGADYSQLEPRIFAYYSKDDKLIQSFASSDDFYSVIGMSVYDKNDCVPKKDGSPNAFGVKYKKLRDQVKVFVLATTYGASAYKLAPLLGKNVEDTQADLDKYFEEFPGVRTMMLEAHQQAKKNGYVCNLFGRPRRMPEALEIERLYGNVEQDDLPYTVRNLMNLAVNHRIQSTAASIVNRAAIRLHSNIVKANIDCNLVIQVHDSLVLECWETDAEDISVLLQDAMENTISLSGIKFEAIPKIGHTLADV